MVLEVRGCLGGEEVERANCATAASYKDVSEMRRRQSQSQTIDEYVHERQKSSW